jgi:LysR family transcriptional regulator of gallate degradation
VWSNIPNLRHLRAFALVVDNRSISRAAERIHLSQPAITQALGKLEERVGTKLVEHGPDGMTPTPAGRLFHDRAKRALAYVEAGAREAVRLEPRRGSGGFTNFDQMVTVAQLRALSAMAVTGNFSLAAREMGLSQPSIHRAARDLERLTGLELFVATRQGIELTRAAEALARNANLALAELQQGFTEVAEVQGLDSSLIVVGSMPLAQTRILPEALNLLAAERPRTNLRVIAAPYDGLLGRLRNGIIDFLIGALRDPVPIDDVEQEFLFDDPLSIVVRAGHPLAGRKSVSRSDLLAFPWLVPGEDTPTREVFRQFFTQEEIARTPGGVVEASQLILVRGILAESDRLTILSARQALYELQQGILVELPVEIPSGTRRIGLTFRKSWRPTATQARLLDHLRKIGKSYRAA